jgi:aminoglycoside/choline kinase family phosphotransferase
MRKLSPGCAICGWKGAGDLTPHGPFKPPIMTDNLYWNESADILLMLFTGYLNLDIEFEDLTPDFYHLADRIQELSYEGFMHRDFQSRNIMVNGADIFFIDFQGGRMGPIQYDLASLLIDPYTALSQPLQAQLLNFAPIISTKLIPLSPERFQKGFHYCAISRNLQILGAFGFLSRVKKKFHGLKNTSHKQ